MVTEVIVPGLVAIVLLGDTVRSGWWPAMLGGLMLAVLGGGVLAGAPAVNHAVPHAHPARRPDADEREPGTEVLDHPRAVTEDDPQS
jgi:hypothetical protein